MGQITLFCQDSHSLKLGPGEGNQQNPGQLIVFDRNYATFEEEDFPDWRAWQAGAPHIEVLEGDEVAATDAEFVCPTCNKAFASLRSLNGHRLTHAPRREAPVPKPAAAAPAATPAPAAKTAKPPRARRRARAKATPKVVVATPEVAPATPPAE